MRTIIIILATVMLAACGNSPEQEQAKQQTELSDAEVRAFYEDSLKYLHAESASESNLGAGLVPGNRDERFCEIHSARLKKAACSRGMVFLAVRAKISYLDSSVIYRYPHAGLSETSDAVYYCPLCRDATVKDVREAMLADLPPRERDGVEQVTWIDEPPRISAEECTAEYVREYLYRHLHSTAFMPTELSENASR